MGDVRELFPKKAESEVRDVHETLIYWKQRNETIAETFYTLSVYQKQEMVEALLEMNYDLCKLVLKLKGELV